MANATVLKWNNKDMPVWKGEETNVLTWCEEVCAYEAVCLTFQPTHDEFWPGVTRWAYLP